MNILGSLLIIIIVSGINYTSETRIADNIICSNWINQRYLPYKSCDVYLYGALKESTHYVKELDLISKGSSYTKIVLHLEGPGGEMTTLDLFDKAIKNGKSKIVAHIDGNVFSADSTLALLASEVKVADDYLIMFHDIQFDRPQVMRLLGDDFRGALLILTQARALLIKIVEPILTKEELNYILEDHTHQIYLTGKELKERLIRVK